MGMNISNMMTNAKYNFWRFHHNRGINKKIYEGTVKPEFKANLQALSNSKALSNHSNYQFDEKAFERQEILIYLTPELKASQKSGKSELDFRGKNRLEGLTEKNILDYCQSIFAVKHLEKITFFDGNTITIKELKKRHDEAQKLEAENRQSKVALPIEIVKNKFIVGHNPCSPGNNKIEIPGKKDNKITAPSSTSNKKKNLILATPPTVPKK